MNRPAAVLDRPTTEPDRAPYVRLRNGTLAPVGVWLAAHSPTHEPYPCRCASIQGCERVTTAEHCPCWKRIDNLDHITRRCCARRAAESTLETA